MTAFKPNACPQELTAVAVFTIKRLKQADHALHVSMVFGAELKSVLPVFFYFFKIYFYPLFLFPADSFFLHGKSILLP